MASVKVSPNANAALCTAAQNGMRLLDLWGMENVIDAFVGAAEHGQEKVMHLLYDTFGSVEGIDVAFNRALVVAAKDGQLDAMRLLHKWGAVLPATVNMFYLREDVMRLLEQWALPAVPTVPMVPVVPTVDRSSSASLRKEFFRSVISRLTPVHEDYDQFVLISDTLGNNWSIRVETTKRAYGDRAWILEADEEKATYCRSGLKSDIFHWNDAETETFSDREQARAIKIVSIFENYMRETM